MEGFRFDYGVALRYQLRMVRFVNGRLIVCIADVLIDLNAI